ncbi:MAG: hypothetical protein B7X02_00420 [Rhodospirillales bacterium 12-54-5]|nr:MAG: hypothetical protein B7X02_00420 [Rhodospirillales bacterium 12-54-5]
MLDNAMEFVSRETISPNQGAAYGLSLNQDGMKRSILDLLGYAHIEFEALAAIWPEMHEWRIDIREQIEIEALYKGYLGRQQADIENFKHEEHINLPDDLNYDAIGSLSNEIRAKLKAVRPASLGAAGRIPGVTPASLTAVLSYIRRQQQAA